ncbi:unnamed protein product, partial [Prorocentrum cordatum]
KTRRSRPEVLEGHLMQAARGLVPTTTRLSEHAFDYAYKHARTPPARRGEAAEARRGAGPAGRGAARGGRAGAAAARSAPRVRRCRRLRAAGMTGLWRDPDGDVAHEFWEEDPRSGDLLRVASARLSRVPEGP